MKTIFRKEYFNLNLVVVIGKALKFSEKEGFQEVETVSLCSPGFTSVEIAKNTVYLKNGDSFTYSVPYVTDS